MCFDTYWDRKGQKRKREREEKEQKKSDNWKERKGKGERDRERGNDRFRDRMIDKELVIVEKKRKHYFTYVSHWIQNILIVNSWPH